jgi:integrase
MTNSTPDSPRRRGRAKKSNHQAAKPTKDFPLTAHPSGRWCKKVKGRLHYFGALDDPQKALERWLAEKDYLLAGRQPPRADEKDSPNLESLVNAFLTTKRHLVDSGERSRWTLVAQDAACERVLKAFGWDRKLTDIGPADFERLRSKWAKTWGPERIAAEVNRTRAIFNYAYKNGLVDRPIKFGEGFARPSKKVLRLHREERGPKMFECGELCRMIHAATQPLHAMLLLAVNAALGNNDVGQLRMKHLDLKAGWLNYPRPKTGVRRRVPLWLETRKAIEEWLALRPTPRKEADADRVFLTSRGCSWACLHDRPLTKVTRKLLDRLGINGSRGFYGCRHTFETVAGESRDQVAVDAVMGHDDGSMANVYRDYISDKRLLAVVNHVWAWLFGKAVSTNLEAEKPTNVK